MTYRRVAIGLFLVSGLLLMQGDRAFSQTAAAGWDVSRPRGNTRVIDFTTSEGTWMSVDISPDSKWIIFDLLGQVYRVSAGGGDAECLTQDSGIALNMQPRYSPDGRSIAFISDRKGQNNLWIMDADGKNPRPVFVDNNVRVWEPAWSPDGQFLFVRRQDMTNPNDYSEAIWMYNRDGGQGIQILGDAAHAFWPSVSKDDRFLYFHAAQCLGFPIDPVIDPIKGCFQLRQLDLTTGEIFDITAGRAMQQIRGSSGGPVAPQISPDGRWLAFARRIPDGTISFKGHQFGPRNALWIRDLTNGEEHLAMDPIETDIAEQFPTQPRLLPAYNWASDSKSIVISQGGKIRRLWIDTHAVETVPFRAHVHRVISEMTYSPFRISDTPFEARFLRWPTASPSGHEILFQAIGKIWIVDAGGGPPRRLTPESFLPSEFSPAWSPDGHSIAFTSWDGEARGQLWKVAVPGGAPEQLTQEAGEYFNPTWTPDSRNLIVARGAGATGHGFSLRANTWYEFVRVSASGGPAQPIVRLQVNRQRPAEMLPRASFGPNGRIYYLEPRPDSTDESHGAVTELVSVTEDGRDKRWHAKVPDSEEAAISPDGKWLAFERGSNVYLTPLPAHSASAVPEIETTKAPFPVKALTQEGGLYPHWRDAGTLEFGSGDRYFAYHLDTQRLDSTKLSLVVPRAIPKGGIALTNARLVTMEGEKVIERGTVVIKAGRITCVGQCDTTSADKTIDLTGKTILPGFVDVHAHHHREHQGILPTRDFEQAVYLAYGVTTTRDPATSSNDVFPTAEMVEAGVTIGPRVYSTGEPLFNGNGPHWNELDSYETTEHEVQRLASWGATSIKQYLQPQRQQRQWVAEAARKVGRLMVTAEGEDAFYDLSMIMDGQTGWEHPMLYLPLYSDVAKFFGQAKATYSPTDIVGSTASYNDEYFYQASDVWKDEKQREWMPWLELIPQARRRTLRPVTDYDFPLTAQALADIMAEGGYGAIGGHGQQHGLGSHWEIWMYATALGPMKALEVATMGGARFIGIDRDIGSISTGKLGDLIVLNSSPLVDIHNTLDMVYVLKAGRVYDASTLDEIWPEAKAFGKHYWVNPDALRSDDRPVSFWDQQR